MEDLLSQFEALKKEIDKLQLLCDTLPKCQNEDACDTCENYEKIMKLEEKLEKIEEEIDKIKWDIPESELAEIPEENIDQKLKENDFEYLYENDLMHYI